MQRHWSGQNVSLDHCVREKTIMEPSMNEPRCMGCNGLSDALDLDGFCDDCNKCPKCGRIGDGRICVECFEKYENIGKFAGVGYIDE